MNRIFKNIADLSNLDNCQSSEDMQTALEAIHEIVSPHQERLDLSKLQYTPLSEEDMLLINKPILTIQEVANAVHILDPNNQNVFMKVQMPIFVERLIKLAKQKL